MSSPVFTVRGPSGTNDPCETGAREPGTLATSGISLRFLAMALGLAITSPRIIGERGVSPRALQKRLDGERDPALASKPAVATRMGDGLLALR